MNMTSEAAIDAELQRRGYNKPRIFQPNLMQGIMIGNVDRADSLMQESYTYHALDDYGLTSENNDAMYAAFVESINEMTWLVFEETVLNKYPRNLDETKRLANEYAMGKR